MLDSSVSSASESPEIVRHILEDDGDTNWNSVRGQSILSPEEQQKKSDERNTKIYEMMEEISNKICGG